MWSRGSILVGQCRYPLRGALSCLPQALGPSLGGSRPESKAADHAGPALARARDPVLQRTRGTPNGSPRGWSCGAAPSNCSATPPPHPLRPRSPATHAGRLQGAGQVGCHLKTGKSSNIPPPCCPGPQTRPWVRLGAWLESTPDERTDCSVPFSSASLFLVFLGGLGDGPVPAGPGQHKSMGGSPRRRSPPSPEGEGWGRLLLLASPLASSDFTPLCA